MTASVCVTFDNMGPQDVEAGLAGYPRLLALLDDLGVTATFFVEGWNGEHQRDRVAELVARGHEVGVHGWAHERWASLDRDEAGGLLDRSLAALAGAGADVTGFRAPGGERGEHTVALLAERGLLYDASLDEQPARRLPEGVVAVPFDWRHVDGAHYLRPEPRRPRDVASRWLADLDALATAGDGTLVLISHAHITGVDTARLDALRSVLERVTGDERLRPCTAGAAAAAFL